MTGWLNTKDAAAYARVSPGVIKAAAARGDLSGCKVTPGSVKSEWRFTAGDIDTWLERGRVSGPRRPRRRGEAA